MVATEDDGDKKKKGKPPVAAVRQGGAAASQRSSITSGPSPLLASVSRRAQPHSVAAPPRPDAKKDAPKSRSSPHGPTTAKGATGKKPVDGASSSTAGVAAHKDGVDVSPVVAPEEATEEGHMGSAAPETEPVSTLAPTDVPSGVDAEPSQAAPADASEGDDHTAPPARPQEAGAAQVPRGGHDAIPIEDATRTPIACQPDNTDDVPLIPTTDCNDDSGPATSASPAQAHDIAELPSSRTASVASSGGSVVSPTTAMPVEEAPVMGRSPSIDVTSNHEASATSEVSHVAVVAAADPADDGHCQTSEAVEDNRSTRGTSASPAVRSASTVDDDEVASSQAASQRSTSTTTTAVTPPTSAPMQPRHNNSDDGGLPPRPASRVSIVTSEPEPPRPPSVASRQSIRSSRAGAAVHDDDGGGDGGTDSEYYSDSFVSEGGIASNGEDTENEGGVQ